MMELTNKQNECLEFIKSFIKEKGTSPTVREIAKQMGCNSPATIHHHLKLLRDKKYIEWTPKQKRSIKVIV